MKHLLILGAGGMGKEMFYIAKTCIGYGTEFEIKGFLDFPNPDWNTDIYPPILGLEDEYEILPDDVFTCSIGEVALKRKVCEKMKARGAKFQTLICKDAQVNETAAVGEGTIVDHFSIVGSDTVIGENCLIQAYTAVGHDCQIGNYVRIDNQCTCVGGTQICDGATVHTGCVINHGVVVGENAKVGAMSFVIRKVKPNTLVQGNPARIVEF